MPFTGQCLRLEKRTDDVNGSVVGGSEALAAQQSSRDETIEPTGDPGTGMLMGNRRGAEGQFQQALAGSAQYRRAIGRMRMSEPLPLLSSSVPPASSAGIRRSIRLKARAVGPPMSKTRPPGVQSLAWDHAITVRCPHAASTETRWSLTVPTAFRMSAIDAMRACGSNVPDQ